MYDDGQFKNKTPYSKHPNVLKSLITAKKSWGLWLDQWTDGIAEWCFTEEEIYSIFEDLDIKIPESFKLDFKNRLEKKKLKRYK